MLNFQNARNLTYGWSEGGGVASRERLTFRFASAQRPRASFPGPPPAGPARQRSLRVRPSVRSPPPKVQKCAPGNVDKRQSNSYISTLRFHPPRGVENVMVWESLLVTLGHSGVHLAQENAWFRDVDFCFLPFAILHRKYKMHSIFKMAKTEMRIRYATQGLEAPKVVRGVKNDASHTRKHRSASVAFSLWRKVSVAPAKRRFPSCKNCTLEPLCFLVQDASFWGPRTQK